MPVFKTHAYYQPQNITKSELAQFMELGDEIKQLEAQKEQEFLNIQSSLKDIVTEIEKTCRTHRHQGVPIFIMTSSIIPPTPLKSLAQSLEKMLATEKKLDPQKVLLELQLCVDEYKNNELDHGFDSTIELRLQFQNVVFKAREVGRDLAKDFAHFFNILEKIMKPLQRYEQEILDAKEQLQKNRPTALYQLKLENAFRDAILRIQQEADGRVKKEGKEAMGIRGLCSELLKNPHRRVAQLIPGYGTLSDRKEKGYASTQIKLIEELQALHEDNLQRLREAKDEDFYNQAPAEEEAMNPEDPFALQELDPRAEAVQSLKDLLNNYLIQRQSHTVLNEQKQIEVKEYYYPFFTSFQKSYTQKKNAVDLMLRVLNGEEADMQEHVDTLKNGNLGKALQQFIKAGSADYIVGRKVRDIADLVASLPKPWALNFEL